MASWRHLKANVLHHPVQANNLHFNPYNYILYYPKGVLETASQRNSCTHHDITLMMSLYAIIMSHKHHREMQTSGMLGFI